MENSRFKFSVIIPVYNVENYLEETIQSVIHQTIGFKKNIQIILVNDGSPDDSGKICEKYQREYPDNIVYVEQKNAGVSAARNNGLKYAEGEIISFLDSDDKWGKTAFKRAYRFFQKYGNEIDIVAGRIKYFEMKDNYHVLDYKFDNDKLVDIQKDHEYIQLSMATTFVRAEALKGRQFDSRIRYGEDCLLINTILFDKCKYGVIRDCVYYYRMRNTGTSAMQNTISQKTWYFDTEKLVFQHLLEMSKEKFGKPIKYVQYLVMYDMKWRLRTVVPSGVLTEEEKKQYLELLHVILQDIDDDMIATQKNCLSLHYLLAYQLKYQKDCRDEITFDGGLVCFHGQRLTHMARRRFLTLDFVDIKDNVLEITGQADYWIYEDDYKILFEDQNGTEYYPTYYPLPFRTRHSLLGDYGDVRGYHVSIPLAGVRRLRAVFEYKNGERCYMMIGYGKFCQLTHAMDSSYGLYDHHILRAKGKTIYVQKKTRKRYRKCERRYCLELVKKGYFKECFYRYATRVFRKIHSNKKIWLLSDRINLARDNGEALFQYLNRIDTGNVDVYFDISKKCSDYERMKQIGKVVPHGSFRYCMYFLSADKIISAHIDEYVINAFGVKRDYLKNLFRFDFVFLQHGLTKDDLSGWVNRFNKNISLFVTAAKPEYQSIVDGNYFYTDKEVKLTGFPRFDNLVANKTKKQIIILPTWRKQLANSIDQKTGQRIYNDTFKNSAFFKFYDRLIQDERLLDCMREHGYTGKFCLHVNHMEQIGDYHGNDVIQIHEGALNYQKEFVENALMITDYSSVAFDFAYMKKSLVYAQFDREAFFEGQTYDEGYFNYETDGFGPVCYDYETTVQSIIDAIKRDCEMSEEYKKRVDNFYYKTDTDNCKRVYEAILAIDQNKEA